VLGSILDSSVLDEEVRFTRYRKTLPAEGGALRRFAIDAWRFWRSITPRPEVFHLHVVGRDSIYREFPLFEAAGRLGIKTICDVRTGGLQHHMANVHDRLQNWMLERMFRSADALLAECRGDCEFIQRRTGRTPLFHPNVMLREVFEGAPLASLPPPPGSPLRLIYTGRFIPEKGLHTMLSGLELLSRQDRAVELHLVGEGDDAELNERIRTVSQSPPSGTRVVDHGWMDRGVLELLSQSHVFAMLTSWPGEGHSFSLLEAMTCGLGIILSAWPHMGPLVPAAHTKVVDPGDVEGFAAAVGAWIDHPEQLAESGSSAREFVASHFIDSQFRLQLLELYRELAGRVPGRE
jgi:glycosyltransferase involved in cell wall biosynthesis